MLIQSEDLMTLGVFRLYIERVFNPVIKDVKTTKEIVNILQPYPLVVKSLTVLHHPKTCL